MRYLLICIFTMIGLLSFSQNKQDYVWLLGIDQSAEPGNQAYRFDFNNTPFEILESNNGLGFASNNASICDKDGNLMFYTNGCAVLNRDAEVMPNGDSLNYDIWMEILNWDDCDNGYPGTENIMILDNPADEDLFYVLHKPRIFNGYDSIPYRFIRLWYSIVDMSLQGGLGDVVEKNIPLYDEKDVLGNYLTAIRHENGADWWIIQPLSEDSVYLTFLISENGIIRKEDQESHEFFSRDRTSGTGTAKFSPDGTKYALYTYYNNLHLFDFDRGTGLLYNHNKVIVYDSINDDQVRFNSVEWSPNSRFIYTASKYDLHQIDTWESDIQDGIRLIDSYNGTIDPFPTIFYLMAQGPDCRIYMCPTSSTNSYHVINHPNELGKNCDFVQNGIQLPMTSTVASFPNFPRFRVDEEEKCDSTIVSVFGMPVYFQKQLKVYPNPTSNIASVKIPENKKGIIVLRDNNGNLVLSERVPSQTEEMQFSLLQLVSGIYYIEFIPEDSNKKVIYSGMVEVIK